MTQGLRTLLLVQGALVAGIAVAFPFFALYLHRERELPMTAVGAVMSGLLVVSGLANAAGGELSDLWGPKRVMEWALALRAASAAGLAWAIHEGAAVWILVLVHLVSSFFGNLYDPATRAWIAARVPPKERVAGYSWLRVAVNAGWAVGPALGGFLAGSSYSLLFAASAASAFACLLVLRWRLSPVPASRPEQAFSAREIAAVFSDRRYLELCLWVLAISVVTTQLVVGISIHSVSYAGLTEPQVGLLFSLNGLLVVFAQAGVTGLLRGVRLTAAQALGCLLYAAGYACVGFAYGLPMMAAAMVVVTLGEIVLWPSATALAANLAPPARQGRYMGFQGLAHQIGSSLAPLLGGAGLQYLSPRWAPAPWLCLGAVGAVSAFGFWRFGRRLTPAEDGVI